MAESISAGAFFILAGVLPLSSFPGTCCPFTHSCKAKVLYEILFRTVRSMLLKVRLSVLYSGSLGGIPLPQQISHCASYPCSAHFPHPCGTFCPCHPLVLKILLPVSVPVTLFIPESVQAGLTSSCLIRETSSNSSLFII